MEERRANQDVQGPQDAPVWNNKYYGYNMSRVISDWWDKH